MEHWESLVAGRNGSAELPLSASTIARALPTLPGYTPRETENSLKKGRERLALDLMIMERLVKAAFKCTPCLRAEKQLKKWGGRGNNLGTAPDPSQS